MSRTIKGIAKIEFTKGDGQREMPTTAEVSDEEWAEYANNPSPLVRNHAESLIIHSRLWDIFPEAYSITVSRITVTMED